MKALACRVATVALACLAAASAVLAENGAFESTAHGNPITGPERVANRPRGSCGQCHEQHAAYNGTPINKHQLFAPNDDDLCFTCHALPSANGVFPGSGAWQSSGHARAAGDAAKCVTCHDPHGVRDGSGLIPSLLVRREPELCVTCHDGSSAADIRDQLTKPYWHGMNAMANRSVACADCHNSHLAIKDRVPPVPPAASSRLAGTSRVEVANGAAGTAPRYTLRAADDPSPISEYEICFKCHSGYPKTQPPGQTDQAIVTNPANPSFHPIQARGRNANIDPNAWVAGYDPDALIACTSCHGTDDANIRGPHGSAYQHLLKKASGTTTRDDLCFSCHAYDVYGNAASTADVQAASRFNSGQGHAFHVGLQNIPCSACHDAHGSTRYSFLIRTGRFPGITSFVETPTGGTCTSTCHAAQTYTVGYAR